MSLSPPIPKLEVAEEVDEEVSSEADDDDFVQHVSEDETQSIHALLWKLDQDEGKTAMPNVKELPRPGEKDAFKLYIRYITSLLLDPGFADWVHKEDRDAFRQFIPALEVVTEMMTTKRDQWVNSGSWRGEFLHAIHSRPQVLGSPLEREEWSVNQKCQACFREKNATRVLTFRGVPYDADALKFPLRASALRVAEEEDKDQETFAVGVFCSSRVRLFHAMYHHKFHLLAKVCREVKLLQDAGGLSPDDMLTDIMNKRWITELYEGLQSLNRQAEKYMGDSRFKTLGAKHYIEEMQENDFSLTALADTLSPEEVGRPRVRADGSVIPRTTPQKGQSSQKKKNRGSISKAKKGKNATKRGKQLLEDSSEENGSSSSSSSSSSDEEGADDQNDDDGDADKDGEEREEVEEEEGEDHEAIELDSDGEAVYEPGQTQSLIYSDDQSEYVPTDAELSDAGSESEYEEPQPRKKTKSRRQVQISDNDDDEEYIPASSGRKRVRSKPTRNTGRRAQKKAKKSGSESAESDSSVTVLDDENEDQVEELSEEEKGEKSVGVKKKQKRRRLVNVSSSSDDGEEEEVQQRTRTSGGRTRNTKRKKAEQRSDEQLGVCWETMSKLTGDTRTRFFHRIGAHLDREELMAILQAARVKSNLTDEDWAQLLSG